MSKVVRVESLIEKHKKRYGQFFHVDEEKAIELEQLGEVKIALDDNRTSMTTKAFMKPTHDRMMKPSDIKSTWAVKYGKGKKKENEIFCIITAHGREPITRQSVARLLERQTVPVSIVLVGDSEVERKIAEDYGTIFVGYHNSPLSWKLQAGIEEARKYFPEAIMIGNSDDWYSDNWVETGLKYIKAGHDFIGAASIFFLNVRDNGIMHWNGNHFGAGEMLSRKLLDGLDWMLYNHMPPTDRSLDNLRREFLTKRGVVRKDIPDHEAIALGIKGNWGTLNDWDSLKVQGEVVGKMLPEPEKFLAENFPDYVLSATKTIFFVFVGELGYEIIAAHGWLRKLRKEHPNIIVGVASRGGAEYLYQDAADIYVDCTDILKDHPCSMFGRAITKEIKKKIEEKCLQRVKTDKYEFAYSNEGYGDNDIVWGQVKGSPTKVVRNEMMIKAQAWLMPDMGKYPEHELELANAYPKLLKGTQYRDYIVLQDRRSEHGWGQEKYSIRTWLEIIDRFIKAGMLPVLIGYKPYKKEDSYSCFYRKEFQNIKGAVNVSDLLTKHIEDNLIYQALIIDNAKMWIGVWGSIGMIPALLGKRTFILTAGRGDKEHLDRDIWMWKKAFAFAGGETAFIETTQDMDDVLYKMEGYGLFKKYPPFLSVVTRCNARPKALIRNQKHLSQQTDNDYEQILIPDHKSRGKLWANQQFYINRHRVNGKWVYLVDDDDYIINDNLIRDLKEIEYGQSPDAVICKQYIENIIFPKDGTWKKDPVRKKIATECIIVRNEIFQKHIKAFGSPSAGDYFFIKDIMQHEDYKIFWWNRINVRAAIGKGKQE